MVKLSKSFLTRTLKMSVIEGFDFASASLGNGASGPLFASLGYFGCYGISTILHSVLLFYIIFCLKESVVKSTEEEKDKTTENIFKKSINYTLESMKTVVKPREGYRRLFVFLCVFAYICYFTAIMGIEGSHRIYFAENKYKWSERELAAYYTNYKLAQWIGLWVAVPLLTKYLKVSDCILACIATFLVALGSFLLFSTFLYIFFTGSLLPVFTDSSEWFRVGNYVMNWFQLSNFFYLMFAVTYLTSRFVWNYEQIHIDCLVKVSGNSGSVT